MVGWINRKIVFLKMINRDQIAFCLDLTVSLCLKYIRTGVGARYELLGLLHHLNLNVTNEIKYKLMMLAYYFRLLLNLEILGQSDLCTG